MELEVLKYQPSFRFRLL